MSQQSPIPKKTGQMENYKEFGLRRAMQVSLLHCVTPNLRRVNAIQVGEKIILNFYYERIAEEETELPDEVETEMWGFYYGEAQISTNVFVLPYPAPIPQEGLCVYSRFEEVHNLDRQAISQKVNEDNMKLAVSYVTQVALLGCITSNLRKVQVIEENTRIVLNFYYDDITDLERDIPSSVAGEVRSFFSGREVIVNVDIVPFPSQLPDEGYAVYARYEKSFVD